MHSSEFVTSRSYTTVIPVLPCIYTDAKPTPSECGTQFHVSRSHNALPFPPKLRAVAHLVIVSTFCTIPPVKLLMQARCRGIHTHRFKRLGASRYGKVGAAVIVKGTGVVGSSLLQSQNRPRWQEVVVAAPDVLDVGSTQNPRKL